ncbi:hypothetical protein DFQ13_102217 [Actinokineospora spheciospongiae]|nr:hypothetical protein DFQ13_102217 [Actinokineospora spheciospongiae]
MYPMLDSQSNTRMNRKFINSGRIDPNDLFTLIAGANLTIYWCRAETNRKLLAHFAICKLYDMGGITVDSDDACHLDIDSGLLLCFSNHSLGQSLS